jgi:membrane protease YdiL (CAAX protease family)
MQALTLRLGSLLFLPGVLMLYFGFVVGGAERLGRPYRDRYGPGLYFAFIAVTGGVAAILAPVPVEVELAPTLPAAVVAGGGLYFLDRGITAAWYDDADAASAPPFRWAFPMVLGPAVEEYLYRAWLAPLAEFDPRVYVGVSAALFGLIHFYEGRHEVVLKTFDGAVYATTYLLTGNFAVPVLLHVGYNGAFLWSAREK